MIEGVASAALFICFLEKNATNRTPNYNAHEQSY